MATIRSSRAVMAAVVGRFAVLGGLALGATVTGGIHAQVPLPREFDVVSIRRVEGLRPGGSMRTSPDGTFTMTNSPLVSIILLASPVPVSPRDVIGLPEWMYREPYDVIAKPPPGLTPAQLGPASVEMWRAVFADRMKLVAHVEEREKDAFALVLARGDARLGAGLTPSTLDCAARAGGAAPAASLQPAVQDPRARCGITMSRGLMVSGGATLAQLARSMGGLAGGEVEDRTGLMGIYAVNLTFSLGGRSPAADVPVDDAPDFVTAVQEQLGLRLERYKKMTPVFVVDRIERPSEN